jgi:hypothetical protein
MTIRRIVVLLFALLAVHQLACGYKMQAADYTTLQKLAPNCAENVVLLSDGGVSGPPATLSQLRGTDKVCVCGARAILARAGQPEPDAGKLGCPQ